MRLRDDDSALLSIDFLAGFTVFLLAFIIAASMVPGMLASLQSSSVDYDAVAYRTGVILAEDPGWFEDTSGRTGSHWQGEQEGAIQRMGLAVSKDAPGILSTAKVERFFQDRPESDYRSKVFFSDYPYAFNISLKKAGETPPPIGAPLPADTTDYGSIRRAVMIKENASLVINGNSNPIDTTRDRRNFTVTLNFPAMLEKPAAYRVNPYEDTIEVRLENLDNIHTDINLTSLTLIKHTDTGTTTFYNPFQTPKSTLKIDGNTTPVDNLPEKVNNTITITLDPGFFTLNMVDPSRTVDIQFSFDNTTGNNIPHYLAGNSEYSSTSPSLVPAVLEVAVW
ncbi:hypothetical protein E2N92_08630 [Methanofollis formosanus]|uniref:Uncharacterized protein n=1 Tax=Methanofollis formosanus TaxID=299308 RepID=A0A8G1EGT6_9EURY|nr:hypothetical protein [Methanofollis formosanus]QYZ79486.1 hypothetical protein E2N92_08630 [Methanofollis formosanus]